MSNTREDSPDWLRAFQPPTHSVLALSSDSEASPKNIPLKGDTVEVNSDSTSHETQLVENDEDLGKVSSKRSAKSATTKSIDKKTPRKRQKVEGTPAKRRKVVDSKKKTGKEVTTELEKEPSEKQTEVHTSKASILTLSSDSESDAIVGSGTDKSLELKLEEQENDMAPEGKFSVKNKKNANPTPTNKKTNKSSAVKLVEKEIENGMDLIDDKDFISMERPEGQSPMKKTNADHTPTDKKKMDTKDEAERASEKHVESHVSSSVLPLVIPEKVQRSKVLVECEGNSIDLSGDVGAVGRVIVSGNPPGDRELLLDLKGTIYKTTVVPSRTFCVVSVGPSEAKIEAIMNDFIQLKPQSNVYDAETMVEGSLDGFNFDSEDEADKVPKGDKKEGADEQTNEKPKAKSARKPAGVQKKAKAPSTKQVKKRKPPAAKKGKGKK